MSAGFLISTISLRQFRLSLTDRPSALNIARIMTYDRQMVSAPGNPLSAKMLRFYYVGTAVFLLLDYLFGINVRLASLDAFPGWRAIYYLVCFACLGLMACHDICPKELPLLEVYAYLRRKALTTKPRSD